MSLNQANKFTQRVWEALPEVTKAQLTITAASIFIALICGFGYGIIFFAALGLLTIAHEFHLSRFSYKQSLFEDEFRRFINGG
jgi:hypothetical protein